MIQVSTGITDSDVATSNIASLLSTVCFRLVVGPLTDKYGPQRVMALILIFGSLPLAFSSFISDGRGLIIMRFFIGLLGASFVPCQVFNILITGLDNLSFFSRCSWDCQCYCWWLG
jgi:NNP family nitrate/nitrite transporter-like MFS transporter